MSAICQESEPQYKHLTIPFWNTRFVERWHLLSAGGINVGRPPQSAGTLLAVLDAVSIHALRIVTVPVCLSVSPVSSIYVAFAKVEQFL